MLSRVAESLYWMNRYIERAENTARFVDVNLRLLLDLPGGATEQWQSLIDASGNDGLFRQRFEHATEGTVVAFLTFDADNPNSILSCLSAARENARAVRGSITSEMWEQINRLYLMMRTASSSSDILENPHEFFSEIKLASHLYGGITDASMSHGEGWNFGRLGRLQERADQTSRILDAMSSGLISADANDRDYSSDIQWSAVLRAASAFEMYRQRRGRIESHQVVGFLMFDREFPRSLTHCVRNAQESLEGITKLAGSGAAVSPAAVNLGAALSELEVARPLSENSAIFFQEIINDGLHEVLSAFQLRLNEFGQALFDRYFGLSQVA